MRPSQLDVTDNNLNLNHSKGLYYTYLDVDKCSVLFFAYLPVIFALKATKVCHLGIPASLSRRVGPRMVAAFAWNAEKESWIEVDKIDDGFHTLISGEPPSPGREQLEKLKNHCPFATERALAICAGKVLPPDDWHGVRNLDSCRIDRTEVIQRITVCHDAVPNAVQFRKARVKAYERVMRLVGQKLPAALSDLENGFELTWRKDFPPANVITTEGKLATLVSLDNSHDIGDARRVRDLLLEHIRRSCKNDSNYIQSRTRLCVWFQNSNGEELVLEPNKFTYIDQPSNESPFDIGRAS